jgi:hypothetical protein
LQRIARTPQFHGFSASSWAPLAELVAVDEFEGVGNFLAVMRRADCPRGSRVLR